MARDVMAGAMLRTERAGYRPILTVHDEVVVEAPEGEADFASFMELIQTLPRWATGLPLAAEGWGGERYRK
jgi:DNA polymerase